MWSGGFFSPDGTRILYVARGGSVCVWSLASGDRRLLPTDLAPWTPSWSPDGRSLLMLGRSENDVFWYGLYVVQSRSGATRVLTKDAHSVAPCPSWSPDGREVLFIEEVDPKRAFVTALPAAGGRFRRFAEVPYFTTTCPVFALDGQRIAFARGLGLDGVYVFDRRIGQERRITHPGSSVTDVSWSPGGDTLAFTAGFDSALYLVKDDGTSQRRVYRGTVSAFAWSPDGRRIALVDEELEPGRLVVLDLERGTASTLASAANRTPSWSPDGQRLAFIPYDQDKLAPAVIKTPR